MHFDTGFQQKIKNGIFNIKNHSIFESIALDVFHYQSENNTVYRQYIKELGQSSKQVKSIRDIPFLPISFFKTHRIVTGKQGSEKIFESSGSTTTTNAKHYVSDIKFYEKNALEAFRIFYGNPRDYVILALLPGYLERKNSSLIYMINYFMQQSGHNDNGYYLYDFDNLNKKLHVLQKNKKQVLLIGVSFALLDFAEQHSMRLKDTIIMETGGMKGRRKELTREELHQKLQMAFGVDTIHSEYGMAELLSQCYSQGKGVFTTPPWVHIFIRDAYDPFSYLQNRKTGGINIIDLANIHSCSFIETNDLGRLHSDNCFEVVGRFDDSAIRGCNLMASELKDIQKHADDYQ